MNDLIHILIVEDLPIDFGLAQHEIRKALERCVFRQEDTHAGFIDALETFRPDLILSDYSLPHFDGMTALQLAKERLPLVPVIIWTGSLNEETAVECMKAGASNYVLKENIRRLGPAVVHALKEGRLALERKHADEALRHSEEQFRLIAENTVDLISILDRQGTRLYVSPAHKSVFGEPQELLGTNAFLSVHPDDRENIESIFQEVIRTGTNRLAAFRIMAADGTIRFVETSASAITDLSDGTVARVVIVTRDITEQKRIEQQIQRSQRLESIGTLAGGIAHDLNNILTPIMLSLEVLSRKFPDEQSIRMLEMLKSSVKRGSNMINQVLVFARGVEGERSPVQPRHIIAEVGKIVQETFLKSTSLDIDIPRDLPNIMADPTQIHQVLMNLCVNARDAMPYGGRLEIKAEAVTLDEQYAGMQLNAKPGFYVVVSVTDQGTGIPPGILDRIFEPFFTTKDIGKGTGLGLSTVLAIIKSHNGFVNVYSELGKGTTFKVYLPAVSTEEIVEKEEQEAIFNGNGELILLIEDEPSILEITKQTLESNGYGVTTAADGAEALAVYAAQQDNIALVITDIVLPYMDGTAIIRVLQKMNPGLKIIAVSGLKQNGGNISKDGVTFLGKPYTSEKLLGTIHEVLNS